MSSETAEVMPYPQGSRMTNAEYDAERAKLREIYGDTPAEAGARFEQTLADLFYRSAWTQEELAKKEGKTQQWVAYRLRFGRFLGFTTTVVNSENLPKDLTERRFRSFWERTEKANGNERARFKAVLVLMEAKEVETPRRPAIGEEIIKRFADGKWHKLDTIVADVEADKNHVDYTLGRMARKKPYGVDCEKKQVGTHSEYRIFSLDKTVSVTELTEKLAPIVKGLEVQGRKTLATMDVVAVAYLAKQLRNLLNEWAE